MKVTWYWLQATFTVFIVLICPSGVLWYWFHGVNIDIWFIVFLKQVQKVTDWTRDKIKERPIRCTDREKGPKKSRTINVRIQTFNVWAHVWGLIRTLQGKLNKICPICLDNIPMSYFRGYILPLPIESWQCQADIKNTSFISIWLLDFIYGC